jgi:hypothetical protein
MLHMRLWRRFDFASERLDTCTLLVETLCDILAEVKARQKQQDLQHSNSADDGISRGDSVADGTRASKASRKLEGEPAEVMTNSASALQSPHQQPHSEPTHAGRGVTTSIRRSSMAPSDVRKLV